MGNKVKYNLKNVHAAKLTETADDGGTPVFAYAAPKAIPGAVSISLDAEGETSPFYADGIVYFRSVTNNGYSGDLEIALIPEWFRTEILQEKLDAKGVLVENSGVGESVKFALLFEFDGDVKKSTAMQLEAIPLISALFCEVNPIPVKTALAMMGYCSGTLRLPLCEMSPENRLALQEGLQTYGLI